MMGETILMLAEDPGAANFLAPVAAQLRRGGHDLHVWARGPAEPQFLALGCSFECAVAHTADDLLDASRPSVVVLGTAEDPDALALSLVDAARRRTIPCIGAVDGPASVEDRFRGRGTSPLAHAPDWLLVADASTRRAYASLGFPEDRIEAVGHPLWDHVRATGTQLRKTSREEWRRRLFPHIASERPLIIFLADLSAGLHPGEWRRNDAYTLAGRGVSEARTDIVLEELLDAVAGMSPRPAVVLRLHPKASMKDFDRFAAEIDGFCQGGSPHEAVLACDLVVGMSTILLIEALLLGRSTLSILPRTVEMAWLPSIAPGITPCATRRDQIEPLLRQQLSAVPDIGALEIDFPPGATERVARAIKRIG